MKRILFLVLLFTAYLAKAGSLYWIGGSGSWSSTSNWSFSSGGVASGLIPTTSDSVYFDGNSGLVAASIVNLNLPIDVATFDFSGANIPFQFQCALPSISVSTSLRGSISPVFTGWTGFWNLTTNTTGSIVSNGRTWTNDIKMVGLGVLSMSTLSSTADLYLNSGSINLSGSTSSIANFYSLGVNIRSINLTNTILSVTGTVWNVSSTNFSIIHTNGRINLTNVGTTVFTGGGKNYNELRLNSGPVTIINNNNFKLLKSIPAGNIININNGDVLSVDSLFTTGSCSSKTQLKALTAGGQVSEFIKTGFPGFTGQFLTLNRVHAVVTGTQTYNVALSDTINTSIGWTHIGSKFYWIGNSGNYSSNSHWSLASGGIATSCFPGKLDSVYFDALSFSLPNQQVTFNVAPQFAYMSWAALNQPTVGLMQTDMYAFGDLILDSQLALNQGTPSASIIFRDQATLTSNSSIINANISVVMLNPADSLLLNGSLQMTDSVNFSVFNGGFNSMNYNANFGYFSVNNQLSTTFQRVRFGNSNINISRNFTSTGTTANFQFYAGNSKIYIGSPSSENNLRTANLTFNEVTLYFPKYAISVGPNVVAQPQKLEGNNVFKKLRILPGSYVQMQGGSTQTVIDSLVMNGNCQDSIYLYSSNLASSAMFVKNTPGNVTATCIDFKSVGASGTATFTAYFSTNSGAAPAIANWNLSATPAVTAAFTAVGPFCYNDTTFFNNSSTCFSGNPNDITYSWYFGDGTNTFYADSGYVGIPTPCTPCAGDSVLIINSVPDTNAHIFAGYGSFNVMLITEFTNHCVDTLQSTIQINNPDIFVICSDADTTICAGTPVSFNIGSSSNLHAYAWYLNGNLLNNPPTVNDTLYQTSILQNNDTVSFTSIENGCPSAIQPTFIFSVNPAPVVSLSSNDLDNTICAQSPITFTASGAQQYRFLKNNVPVSGFTMNPTYTTAGLLNGDVIKVIGKYTATGCVDTSAAIVVQVNPLPNTTLTTSAASNVICDNESITFTGGGASTYQFLLNHLPIGVPGVNTFTTSGLSSFDTVQVVGISAAGCSAISNQSFGYVVNNLPNVSLTFNDLDTSICQGTQVNFNAGGGVLYQFYLNGIPTGPLSATNTYNTNGLVNNDQLFVKGVFNGCQNYSDTVAFEVLAVPTTSMVSNDLDSTVCQNTSVTFTATGASTYEFFVSGVSQGPASPLNLFTTNALSNGQSVSVIGSIGACTVAASIPFTILPLPNVPIFSNNPQNTLCAGQAIGINGAGASQYQLYVNGIPFGPQQASASFNPILPVGPNQLSIQGVGANSCISSSPTLNVQVNPIPVITLQSSDFDNIFCFGDTVTITASGANQFQFYLNGASQGSLSNTTTFSSNNFTNGQTITVLGSSLGCTATSAPMTFTVNAIPSVIVTSNDPNNVFCQGDNITYQASGATSYTLSLNGQLLGPPSAVNTLAMQSYPAGSYLLQITGTSNGCSNQSSVNIQINPNPVVTLSSSNGANPVCSGQNITFNATGATQYQFQLNGNNIGVQSGSSSLQLNNLLNGAVVGVIGTSNLGCVHTSLLPPFVVNQTPTTTLTSTELDLALCVGTPVLFTANGATNYQFFVNNVSQGPSSPSATLTLANLQDNDLVEVVGSNQNCIDYSPSLIFNVYNYPNVTIANQGGNQICVGDAVNVIASGANNYQFLLNSVAIGPNSTNNTFTGTLNNGDTLSVIGETFGCSAAAITPISLIVYPYPVLVASCDDIDLTICFLDTVNFSATGAMSYSYIHNSAAPNVSATGLFSMDDLLHGDTILVQGFNGTCPSAIDTFIFNVNSMSLSLSTQPQPLICSGSTLDFQATGASTYLYYVNGVSQGAFGPSGQYSSSTFQDNDRVTFTAFNQGTGCYQPFNDTLLIDVMPSPTITNSSPLTFCAGDSVILFSNSISNNEWTSGGIPVSATTDSTLVVYQTANVTLTQNSSELNQTYSFGYNANGMFGDGTNQSIGLPTEMIANLSLEEISSGWNFALGRDAVGQVYAWGDNSNGQLGNGTFTASNTPLLMPSLSAVKSLATSENSAMVLTNSGNVYVWGNNTYGQLGTGNTSIYNFPYLNPALQNIDTIVGGRRHFLCLRTDGTVIAFGNNTFGQLGLGNLNSISVPVAIPNLTGIEKIGVGEFHSFAIDSSGNLFVWGNNANGQLGLNDNLNRVIPTVSSFKQAIQICGGADFSVILKSDGSVWSTGKNNFGQLGLNDNVDRNQPENVAITGVNRISCGQYHTLLLRNDYSVFGFGDNTESQLSTGVNTSAPIHISTLHGTTFIESGKSTSHAIAGIFASCSASSVSITVNNAPVPVVTMNNGTLSTSAIGTSYQWYFGGQEIQNSNSATYVPITPGYYTVEVTYPSGCSATSIQFAFGIQNLDELKVAKTRIYPVPTNSELTIESLTNELLPDVEIFDASGRLVLLVPSNGITKQTVQVGMFSPGTYVVSLKGGEKLRFMVSH
jgi:alpha-tubulin suppressor-like RCC1 family protein